MTIQAIDLILPVVGAATAGALIGAEREYRASPAGFRTHILVGLSSGLLMLAAVHQIHWLTDTPNDIVRIDPVRMAHGVLTGIGFLCGGVIFREGVTVRGLTTAASLWMTSALGVLFGVGFYVLAVGATIATLLVLAAADITERFLPQRRFSQLRIRYARDAGDTPGGFTALLAAHGIKHLAMSQSLQNEIYEISATIGGTTAAKEASLTSALRADPEVIGFDLDNR
ncbi:MgtC/SapB family protein [Sphingomonas sp. SRS2]|uniref:MgtC/SapB family protein n=1 Tax=Sphingomonas sp. SRS2 TaxID=133190 RepID=UPI00061845E1|nr:MgtC/SapB family protein [Sphingomonas sp. SRS2]KKC25685.1 magnesium transporter [Sphingomonas sp. SRS2]